MIILLSFVTVNLTLLWLVGMWTDCALLWPGDSVCHLWAILLALADLGLVLLCRFGQNAWFFIILVADTTVLASLDLLIQSGQGLVVYAGDHIAGTIVCRIHTFERFARTRCGRSVLRKIALCPAQIDNTLKRGI